MARPISKAMTVHVRVSIGRNDAGLEPIHDALMKMGSEGERRRHLKRLLLESIQPKVDLPNGGRVAGQPISLGYTTGIQRHVAPPTSAPGSAPADSKPAKTKKAHMTAQEILEDSMKRMGSSIFD